ncbi:hypothetical protein ACFLSZ_02930 [Candidatus Bipolaricaulota bacterium]
MTQQDSKIRHVVREETLFAGWRQPIRSRDELASRMEEVTTACAGVAIGPLTHIFRYDTPVDGFDSEIGFAVSSLVNQGHVRTHTLRRLDFFSATHCGPVSTLRETTGRIYAHMNRVGLAPELELVEMYHDYDPADEAANRIEIRGAFLAWPEIYKQQLLRVLGSELTKTIWAGGDSISARTLVDERAAWVGQSLERLKKVADRDQQFDILSRVALLRPAEDTAKYRAIYEESGRSIQAVLDAQNEDLAESRTGGWIDPPYCDGKVLHLSKVARDREAYDKATTPEELRKAYCFCSLIREAKEPIVDPIFCYRAAGWARQFWEPILGIEFERCTVTHSILSGDRFCAWDYQLP